MSTKAYDACEPKYGTKDFFYLMGFRAGMTNAQIVDAAVAYGIQTDIHKVSSQRWHFIHDRGLDIPTCDEVLHRPTPSSDRGAGLYLLARG